MTRPTILARPLVALFLSAAAWSWIPTSAAVAEQPAADTVTVSAVVVRASHSGQGVSGKVGDFGPALQALPYARFVGSGGRQLELSVGATGRLSLPDGVTLRVKVLSADARKVEVSLTVQRDGRTVTSTTVTRPWGKPHVLSAGHLGSDALVVPVKVSR